MRGFISKFSNMIELQVQMYEVCPLCGDEVEIETAELMALILYSTGVGTKRGNGKSFSLKTKQREKKRQFILFENKTIQSHNFLLDHNHITFNLHFINKDDNNDEPCGETDSAITTTTIITPHYHPSSVAPIFLGLYARRYVIFLSASGVSGSSIFGVRAPFFRLAMPVLVLS